MAANWLSTLKQAAQIRSSPGWLGEENLVAKSWPVGISAAKPAVERALNTTPSPSSHSPSADSPQARGSLSVNSKATDGGGAQRSIYSESGNNKRFGGCAPLIIPHSPSTAGGDSSPISGLSSPSPILSHLRSPVAQGAAKPAAVSRAASVSRPASNSSSPTASNVPPSSTKGKPVPQSRKRKGRESPAVSTPKRKLTHLVGHIDVPMSSSLSRPSLPGFSQTLLELQTFLKPKTAAESRANGNEEPSISEMMAAHDPRKASSSQEPLVEVISETGYWGRLEAFKVEGGDVESPDYSEAASPDNSSTGGGSVADNRCLAGASSPTSVLTPHWSPSHELTTPSAMQHSGFGEQEQEQELSHFPCLIDDLKTAMNSSWCDPALGSGISRVASTEFLTLSVEETKMEDSLAAVMESLVNDMAPMADALQLPAAAHGSCRMEEEEEEEEEEKDKKTEMQRNADAAASDFCLDPLLTSGEFPEVDGGQWLSYMLLPVACQEGDEPLPYVPLEFGAGL